MKHLLGNAKNFFLSRFDSYSSALLWAKLEHIKKSEDTEAFPAIFLDFLSPLLPCLAELSAESSQNKTAASSLILYVL